ncbi:MAG: ribonuclease R, partial [Victivallales bacterium]|nr:ribonuclease R [Victivallales bacterium]
MVKKRTAGKPRHEDVFDGMARAKRKTKGHRRSKTSLPAESASGIVGKLTTTPGGLGFVAVEEGSDIFIPPQFVGPAMDGDRVRVVLLPKRSGGEDDDRGPAGKVVEVVERGRRTVVGEMLAGHKVRPLNKRIGEDIQVSGSRCGAKRGDWVELKLLQTEKDGYKRGMVNRKIGPAGSIKTDLDAIVAEYNLSEPYTPQQEELAAKLERLAIDRTDLTDTFTVTIDPHDAKDFDDAISFAPGASAGEVEIGVHIADVAAWIPHGSELDHEAARRGFTSYLPGRTLPMLPRNLTALISLTADSVLPAHTVMMTVDTASGRILKSRRFHSLIRVDKRLTYALVQEFIDCGVAPKDWSRDFAADFVQLLDVFRKMRRLRRHDEKYLHPATTEIRVLCDEQNDKIVGLERKVQREADQLVEECMLAANSLVASELIERNVPGAFRVHPEPDPEKLDEFCSMMAGSFGLYPGELTSREAINKFLSSVEDGPKKPIIMGVFLRALPRALYKEQPELHFGLGKERYCHFTSPIRRYPDLAVHQQLWALDTNGRLRSKK